MSIIDDVLKLNTVVEDFNMSSARAKFSSFSGNLIYGDSRPEFKDGNVFFGLKESANQYALLKRISNKSTGTTEYIFVIKSK